MCETFGINKKCKKFINYDVFIFRFILFYKVIRKS